MCKIENCNNITKIRGFCQKHYMEYRRSSDFQKAYNGRNHCIIEDCNGIVQGHGYCHKHYYKFRKYGDPLSGKIYRGHSFHNHSYSDTYKVYRGMLNRCYLKTLKSYVDYGGRGIEVCPRWFNHFENFLEDMGERPSPTAQIDRINNDGNYEPNNCRWTTVKINSRNRRNSVLNDVLAREIKACLLRGEEDREIAKLFNIKIHNVRDIKYKKCFKEV